MPLQPGQLYPGGALPATHLPLLAQVPGTSTLVHKSAS
jgi:hypothetical protein